LPVNNEGGHIQGIQSYKYGKDEFVFLSGSSDTESYYAIIKIGEENKVISVNPILEKPFKHAGGFQIYKNLMAIGIEDNEARNISKVFIYEINDPLAPPDSPKKAIERAGAYERATAGCVGITTYQEHSLVIVGDWNTRHLDIYSCPLKDWGNDRAQYKLVDSISTSAMPKEDWVNATWFSYQNINLINWQGTLYLVGLGVNEAGDDIADLFLMKETGMKDFYLKKIATQIFEKQEKTYFKWGAGVEWDTENGITRILSSTFHIDSISLFTVFAE
jgi:hypothetical protein